MTRFADLLAEQVNPRHLIGHHPDKDAATVWNRYTVALLHDHLRNGAPIFELTAVAGAVVDGLALPVMPPAMRPPYDALFAEYTVPTGWGKPHPHNPEKIGGLILTVPWEDRWKVDSVAAPTNELRDSLAKVKADLEERLAAHEARFEQRAGRTMAKQSQFAKKPGLTLPRKPTQSTSGAGEVLMDATRKHIDDRMAAVPGVDVIHKGNDHALVSLDAGDPRFATDPLIAGSRGDYLRSRALDGPADLSPEDARLQALAAERDRLEVANPYHAGGAADDTAMAATWDRVVNQGQPRIPDGDKPLADTLKAMTAGTMNAATDAAMRSADTGRAMSPASEGLLSAAEQALADQGGRDNPWERHDIPPIVQMLGAGVGGLDDLLAVNRYNAAGPTGPPLPGDPMMGRTFNDLPEDHAARQMADQIDAEGDLLRARIQEAREAQRRLEEMDPQQILAADGKIASMNRDAPLGVTVRLLEEDLAANQVADEPRWMTVIYGFMRVAGRNLAGAGVWGYALDDRGDPVANAYQVPAGDHFDGDVDAIGTDRYTAFAAVLALGMSLTNLGNVEQNIHTAPSKVQRARARRNKLPLVTYRTLTIRPMTRRRAGGVVDRSEAATRLHLRRGGFRDYRTNGLFGREDLRRVFWFSPTLVGRDAGGVVTKDYEVEP